MSVAPGQSIGVNIGSGGQIQNVNIAISQFNSTTAMFCNGGGNTQVGSISANGAQTKVVDNHPVIGINGGSGGGTGSGYIEYAPSSTTGVYYNVNYGAGGSDGGDGGGYVVLGDNYHDPKYAAKGQGKTTRAFGESDGTLYAGGGGSGYIGTPGGNGGGGRGSIESSSSFGESGSPGTGGGGGGSSEIGSSVIARIADTIGIYGKKWTMYNSAGSGGSGAAIIRWGY